MFGINSDPKPNRFLMLKHTHRKQYDYCFKPIDQGGLGMGDVLDFIHIDYGKNNTTIDDFTK